jgi:hypothetical protein
MPERLLHVKDRVKGRAPVAVSTRVRQLYPLPMPLLHRGRCRHGNALILDPFPNTRSALDNNSRSDDATR